MTDYGAVLNAAPVVSNKVILLLKIMLIKD